MNTEKQKIVQELVKKINFFKDNINYCQSGMEAKEVPASFKRALAKDLEYNQTQLLRFQEILAENQ